MESFLLSPRTSGAGVARTGRAPGTPILASGRDVIGALPRQGFQLCPADRRMQSVATSTPRLCWASLSRYSLSMWVGTWVCWGRRHMFTPTTHWNPTTTTLWGRMRIAFLHRLHASNPRSYIYALVIIYSDFCEGDIFPGCNETQDTCQGPFFRLWMASML